MIYTLEQKNKNQLFIKFYEREEIASARKGKNWELKSYNTELPEFTAKAINRGELKSPKFLVRAGDLEIPVHTEGSANNLMMDLSSIYETVTVERIFTKSHSPIETDIPW